MVPFILTLETKNFKHNNFVGFTSYVYLSHIQDSRENSSNQFVDEVNHLQDQTSCYQVRVRDQNCVTVPLTRTILIIMVVIFAVLTLADHLFKI